MELIKCKGCGNMVSSEAETCPSCGSSVHLSMEQISPELTEAVHKYDELEGFDESLALVEIAGKWGYVEKTGTALLTTRRLSYEFALQLFHV